MTTAKLVSRNLTDHLGSSLPEHIAARCYHNLGTHLIGIVELKAAKHAEDDDGNQSVDLVVTALEVATDPDHDNHLRELQAALYAARQTDTLDGTAEDPDQVVARGQSLLTCEVCLHGLGDTRISHITPDDDGGCEWDCGHVVMTGQDACTNPECVDMRGPVVPEPDQADSELEPATT